MRRMPRDMSSTRKRTRRRRREGATQSSLKKAHRGHRDIARLTRESQRFRISGTDFSLWCFFALVSSTPHRLKPVPLSPALFTGLSMKSDNESSKPSKVCETFCRRIRRCGIASRRLLARYLGLTALLTFGCQFLSRRSFLHDRSVWKQMWFQRKCIVSRTRRLLTKEFIAGSRPGNPVDPEF